MALTDSELADLFRPATVASVDTTPNGKLLIRELRDKGFCGMRYEKTWKRVQLYGIESIDAPGWIKHLPGASVPGGYSGKRWARAWFVRLCECEPCSEEARDQLLSRLCVKGDDAEMLKRALETLVILSKDTSAFAAFVMEQWQP